MLKNSRLIAEIILNDEILMTLDDNILSCEFGSLDRGSITDVVGWGIYANRGSISFIDKSGYFSNLNIIYKEVRNSIIKFYFAKDVNIGQKHLISTFKIEDISIDEESREINLELVSKIIDLMTEKTTSPVYLWSSTSVIDLLVMVNNVCPYTEVLFDENDDNLKKTYIGCTYIEIDTVWNILTKICQATMCRIVEDENGNPIITSSFAEKSPIHVLPHNIINIDNRGFSVLGDNISIDVTKRVTLNNQLLEEPYAHFSIEWDTEDSSGEFLNTTGITSISTYKEEEYGGFFLRIKELKIIFESPYKIFDVTGSKTNLNYSITMHDLSGNNEPDIETNPLSTPTIFFNSHEVLDHKYIVASVNSSGTAVFWYKIEPEDHSVIYRLKSGTTRFYVTTFFDEGTYQLKTNEGQVQYESLQSNDLIQDISTYENYIGGDTIYADLGQHILDEAKRRYSKGIECLEIECLFNDYYKNGKKNDLVFDGKDLSNHFKKYDVIIPYIMKKGQKVPFRKNEDGTPKKFRIIGISYLYDGLLRQRLSVQEERYDVD